MSRPRTSSAKTVRLTAYPVAPTRQNFSSWSQLCGRRSACPARVPSLVVPSTTLATAAAYRRALPDLEASVAGRRLPLHVDRFDASSGRPVLAPAHHRLDALLLSFEDRLERAVGNVPHPARHPQGARPRRRLRSEEHPLDAAAHDHASAGGRHAWSRPITARPNSAARAPSMT